LGVAAFGEFLAGEIVFGEWFLASRVVSDLFWFWFLSSGRKGGREAGIDGQTNRRSRLIATATMQCALVSSKIHSGLCSARYHAADYNQQSNCPSRNLPLCSCAAAPPIMSSSAPSTNPRMLRSGGGGGGGLRTSFVVSDPQQLLQQFQSASEGVRSFSSRRGSVVAIPRAIAATATDVAEVGFELNILLLLLLLCFQASCHPLGQHQEHKNAYLCKMFCVSGVNLISFLGAGCQRVHH